MKLSDILKDELVIKTAGIDKNTEVTQVCCDSRKVTEGALFVAVKGYKSDGNDYIDSALKSGACAVVSEKKLPDSIPHIQVSDSRKALARFSGVFYGEPSKSLKLIGVTGTNGKTTTTYLLKTVLENARGAKVGLIGTNQIIIGDEVTEASRTTPESCELQELFAKMRDAGCEYAVMEVSSHALYLDRVYGLDFDVGIFTNLTQDHLDFHGTMEAYRDAKAKLFDMCKVGVINIDDPVGEYFANNTKCEKFTYGVRDDTGSLTAKNVRMSAAGISYEAVINCGIARVMLGIPGMFTVYNSLGAVGAALCLGLNIKETADAIAKAQGVRGRAEVVYHGDFTVLVDYAHTPDGMENIISTAKEFTKGRVIAVFGCGGDRDKTKRPKMGKIGTEMADVAIITSDNPRTEDPQAIIEDILAGVDKKRKPTVIADRREAIAESVRIAKAGDTVLLLGKGHETYQEINGVKHHFDDREEVQLITRGK